MTTLILVPGEEGAGILFESDSVVVFGVHAAHERSIELLEVYRVNNIIVRGADKGIVTHSMIDEIMLSFSQANVFYLAE